MPRHPKNRNSVARRTLDCLIPLERIQASILLLRGEKVLLDTTLAEMYGVEPRALLQAVRRNIERFPDDFMFQLSPTEVNALRSQLVTSSTSGEQHENLKSQFVISSSVGYGGRRHNPYAFTEQGVAMLSSVLRGQRAVRVNIEIMRTFARLRKMLAAHEGLIRRLDELESRYDVQFRSIFDAIRELMNPPEEDEPKKPPIGFRYVPSQEKKSMAGRQTRLGRQK